MAKITARGDRELYRAEVGGTLMLATEQGRILWAFRYDDGRKSPWSLRGKIKKSIPEAERGFAARRWVERWEAERRRKIEAAAE